MSFKIVPLVRKSFPAEGVQITKENFVEVAEWCKGVLHSEPDDQGNPVPFIKVDVTRPLNEKQTKAFLNDWIVKVGHGFKVFNVHSFERSFMVDESKPEYALDDVLEGLMTLTPDDVRKAGLR